MFCIIKNQSEGETSTVIRFININVIRSKKNMIKDQSMDSPAFFFTFFLWFLLLSATGYSAYVSFGPPSKKLRDPFEEHED